MLRSTFVFRICSSGHAPLNTQNERALLACLLDERRDSVQQITPERNDLEMERELCLGGPADCMDLLVAFWKTVHQVAF